MIIGIYNIKTNSIISSKLIKDFAKCHGRNDYDTNHITYGQRHGETRLLFFFGGGGKLMAG